MATPTSHFVFGTTAAFSHCPPVINLVVSLLTHTPDLAVSVLLHKNNEANSLKLLEGVPQDVVDRLKLYPVGEITTWNNVSAAYIQMVYKSGEEYAKLLMTCAPWPAPSVFIFDYTSFFYITVKSKVEETFPHVKPTKSVGYNPMMAAESLLLEGSVENGSLRWVDDALREFDAEAVISAEANLLINATATETDTKLMPPEERAARMIKAYRNSVTESKRIVKIPGWTPFQVSELWSMAIDWTDPNEMGWFQFLAGRQQCVPAVEAWISCFPSSVIEPETIAAVRQDPFVSGGGVKPYLELGWFESKPKANWGEGVHEFLDKQGEKSVVYISFGTIVNAGFGLPTIFDYLEESKTPYIYACGKQKESLPQHVKDTLAKSEAEGICIAPDWVDQVGVLSHKAVMCFVSHCGVNSVMEGILANTPIVSWGRRGDQVMSAALIHEKGLGVELLQHREGYAIGHPPAHRSDVIIAGKPEALKEELAAAFATIKGPEGDEMRKRMKVLSDEIRAKRTGEWEEAVKAFGKYGRE
ncbi:hypothetical protein IAT38_000476 [Cryptococcus sp. DSM 104549]